MNLKELIEEGVIEFRENADLEETVVTVKLYDVIKTIYINECEGEDDEGNLVIKEKEVITEIEHLIQKDGDEIVHEAIYVYTEENNERNESGWMATNDIEDLDISLD